MRDDYVAKYIEHKFSYDRDNEIYDRKAMVERYNRMYGDRTVKDRVSNRRNITTDMRIALSTILSELLNRCPIETGNARLNGIRYKYFNKDFSVITIGSPSAPYVSLLNLSNKKYRRGPYARKSLYGWINQGLIDGVSKLQDGGNGNNLIISIETDPIMTVITLQNIDMEGGI